jgi:hypothetical protein
MNRLAAQIVPLMTETEVDQAIASHYASESQLLTHLAEANLLKLRELLGTHTPAETERWTTIKKTFTRNLLTGGTGENDPMSRVIGQLTAFGKGLEDIKDTLLTAASLHATPQTLSATTVTTLERLIAGLRAVPVHVQIDVQPVETTATPPPVAVESRVKQ